MKPTILAAAGGALVVMAGCTQHKPASPGEAILSVDRPALVARADLDYTRPVDRSESGLPIGNGRMGTLVWTTPSAVHMQVNRVDVFAVDCDTTSFPEKHTDYCGGCAFVDLDVGGDVFAGPAFRQHLSVKNGLATTNGSGVSVCAIATNDHDLIALEVTDNREMPQPITLSLRMLRPPVVKRFAHTATSAVGGDDGRILLTQRFEEADYYCGSAVAAEMAGRAANVERTGDQEIRLVTAPANGTFVVLVSSAATMDRRENLIMRALTELDTAKAHSFDALLASNDHWWADFWNKSTLHLHSADGVADRLETNFNYYLYLMACTSRGKYPTKFNGMLWTTGGDTRKWGTQFWGANQSCL